VIVTLVPFAEELFFRGLGVRVFGMFGGAAAVAATAVVFALAHGLLVAVPPLLFFALGLAWVRLRSGGVWPGVIAHAAYNGIGLAIAYATIN
jgi:membrane protease YdiL (CAAX protease family)